ncbi:TraR/DksA family transcriptional regulator [Noviherbaspirillum galbum]|uniref:TraR/DksA family transcriptional regulator n=1 Tax=Noviherbaspirillum galbum TaxID=2709383 RepID=A0A6B3SPI3_9BURK|nr:TraR/DksA family transcriptional regulator [Noviherbaspirillum galbum]NEX59639.1 TraR/DksA family transcriptional regulator [Noviherbaspirillum galbum]
MAALTEEQMNAFRDRLGARAQELRDDIRRELDVKDEHIDVASEVPDPGDSSFADLAVDLGNAAVSRDIFEMRAVEAALARTDDGSYGECLDCGSDIPIERLQVQPTAERCIACQEKYEKTHADGARGATM